MRSFQHETASFLTVLAIPAAIALVWPYRALVFRPVRPADAPASAAFVTLSADEEAAALEAAKASWQGQGDDTRRLRVQLSVGELPDDRVIRPLGEAAVRLPAPRAATPFGYPAYSPSAAIPPQAPLPAASAPPPPPAFSRDELLRLERRR